MRAISASVVVLLACSALAAGCSGNPAPPADSGTDVPATPDATDVTPTDVTPTDVTPTDAPPADAPPTGPLPDLSVDADLLAQNAQFTMQYFAPNACEIAEGCVAAPGWRRLLMFTTFTPNSGTADLNLGSSTMANMNFEYSTCHMHYHFRGYADYSLHRMDGTMVALGHKQSFCVEDLQQVDMSAGVRTRPQFNNCGEAGGRQGISRGWADDYYPNLPCQWIDVTDVPAGTYNLRVALNSERRFAEADYSNNTSEVPVTVPADFSVGNPLAACTRTGNYQGVGRNCGWRMEGTHACTPGARISVGCNADCGLGSCVGSWDLRICDGTTPCMSGDAVRLLQQDTGSCSTGVFNLSSTCPVARFTCPASGQYTVLQAPDFNGDTSSSCTLATSVAPAGDAGVGDGG